MSYNRRPKNNSSARPSTKQAAPLSDPKTNPSEQPVSAKLIPPEARETGGLLGWLGRNRRLLGWMELVVTILLLGLALNGFLNGGLFLPFAFGLLSLRFFYAYVQHSYGVNFGRTGTILNLVLMLAALACALLGLNLEREAGN